jgi:hypothetical protein
LEAGVAFADEAGVGSDGVAEGVACGGGVAGDWDGVGWRTGVCTPVCGLAA